MNLMKDGMKNRKKVGVLNAMEEYKKMEEFIPYPKDVL